MISAYLPGKLDGHFVDITSDNSFLLSEASFVDVRMPSPDEEQLLKQYLQLNMPSHHEMSAIEPSNRFYIEDDVVYLTATMVAKSESLKPHTDPVTFILSSKTLLTLRYSEPHSFDQFMHRLERIKTPQSDPKHLLLLLLDAIIDRLADILELISHHLDEYSQLIFRPLQDKTYSKKKVDYQAMMQNIGAYGDLGAKIRESLMSFDRLTSYLTVNFQEQRLNIHLDELKILRLDINALGEYINFIASKSSFLLSATLGMVNIEQNNIIKIFTMVSVIFLPPTLIAGIYGMNFIIIPELKWNLGYLWALVLMGLSAFLPYQYFKKKRWL